MFGTSQSRKVIALLNDAGYEAVFVGGAVRDALLGKEPKDIDIATSATPEQVKSVFKNTIDLGTEHGTVLVIESGEPIEVTTYRTEGTYSDNRRPDEVQFVTSLEEDLKRRDFTINALALRIDGEVVDPFHGREDLSKKTIRAVGNASERFSEDALRMIRAVRFVSVLGFDLDSSTKASITELHTTIQTLSVERIKTEFDKLFQGAFAYGALELIAETKLSEGLPLYPAQQDEWFQCSPFRSSLDGWASLMIAGHFDASEVVSAYKLSNKERLFLQSVQKFYTIRQLRSYTIEDYYNAECSTLVTVEKLLGSLTTQQPIDEHEIRKAMDLLPIRSKQELAVKGKELMEWSGRRGGRWLGEAIQAIEHAVLYRVIPNEHYAIKEWFLHEYECKE
ncbi:CCA tRNA nucleotidyltransferase [Sporosarcina gallistercoris]|uniref:CCA tRNA nucleotidyltransferase n=1 Tax=Sporosarcina gallistercoris TaxID=2762245 RepID=A0ABR8PFK3_9BACL|nr:CCA tRNA nucleotidyltransferase [Sporosarcina gallistercoris]MBD7906936.1 CCA tRNA nucleotidyltransferase [Sporosarcina gallistercoris]